MSKKKPAKIRRDAPPPAPAEEQASGSNHFVIFRETVESLVVAFVLAFLFRTFEAEAFVIPTGSMSPSLQGRHKDVRCDQCGYRFRTSASSEDMEDAGRQSQFSNFHDAEVVGGMCPMCRYPMPYSADLPKDAREQVAQIADVDEVPTRRSYPGDRILVNKYGFDFGEPQRWDVIVFKFPGDGQMNYIKRLVGLPGEELRIFQGDLFVRPLGQTGADFQILRKPPDKAFAMLETVDDTDFEAATLVKAGWPLRWAATTPRGWLVTAEPGEQTVDQRFAIDQPPGGGTAWLRYRHQVPSDTLDWAIATAIQRGTLPELAKSGGGTEAEALDHWKQSIRPTVVTDFNSYNARIHRGHLKMGADWSMSSYLGMNWVGDLGLECDVEVLEPRGTLTLDLVEAGYHFQAAINLEDGSAKLSIIDGRTGKALPFADAAQTPVKGPGEYRLRLANVDDQLHLWVDDELVPFKKAAYDPDRLFAETGGRRGMIPWSDEAGSDKGDLAPAGLGARGAKLNVSRLAVLRDVYYIAASTPATEDAMRMDYPSWELPVRLEDRVLPALGQDRDLFAQPEAWPRFRLRRHKEFDVKEGQLFVMGDNSPESADCRLWAGNNVVSGIPGGAYLDRSLLIGKAICVFWPHSWGGIPGLPKLPGFPNFGDMRLVR
jgi:signal peptidase I